MAFLHIRLKLVIFKLNKNIENVLSTNQEPITGFRRSLPFTNLVIYITRHTAVLNLGLGYIEVYSVCFIGIIKYCILSVR